MTLIRLSLLAPLLALSALSSPFEVHAQFVRELVNNQGATAPCIGIEVGLGLIKKCISTFSDAGFIPVPEVGYSGLTFGSTPKDDGTITGVADGSPAAKAGLSIGDRVLAVDDAPIRFHPGVAAQQAIFGPRDGETHLTFNRARVPLEVTLKRVAFAPPPDPKSPGFMVMMHPLIDWRGVVVPCLGAGLTAPAAFVYCDNHFKPYGYIKFKELGTTGLHFDQTRTDAAVVESVDRESPAAAAGVQVGDELVSVNGEALAPHLSDQIKEHLFGRANTTFHLSIRRGSEDKTAVLILAPR